LVDGTRQPPNNWRSHFSGSAWAWDEATQEYYLHLFAKEQPDLNWENEATREAIYADAMTFWLERGVDGFRIDCVNMYSKGSEYEDAPVFNDKAFEQPAWMIYCNGPRMHEFLTEMNQKVLSKYDAMTVGELPHTPDVTKVLDYVGKPEQLHMVFQFDIVDIGQGLSYKYQFQEWKLPVLKGIVTKWQQFIEGTNGWTTVFCENVGVSPPMMLFCSRDLAHILIHLCWQHDQGRSVTRFASDAPEYRTLSAKMLAMMMCCLTGTLFIYQGQEIGMINVPKDWPIEEYKDIESLNFYNTIASTTNNDKTALDYVLRSIQILGRDNARTPMQWNNYDFAGFMDGKTGKKPWMRVNDVYPEINVARQLGEPDSVLEFWKMLIQLRKKHSELLTHGSFHVFDMQDERTFIFAKKSTSSTALLALNFTSEAQEVPSPIAGLDFLLSNYPADNNTASTTAEGKIRLRPWEGRLYIGGPPNTNGQTS
jgi:oligo-1,6-glucosidase